MTLVLIIIASWTLILSVIVGLCLSARQGDLQEWRASPAYATSSPAEPSIPQITAQPSRRLYPCNPAGIGITTGAKG
jgi:hypothetical protein